MSSRVLAIVVLAVGLSLFFAVAKTEEAKAVVTPLNVVHLLPAPQETVDWALKWRRIAVRKWETWNQAREAFGMKHISFNSPKPPRRANKAEWFEAGRTWKHSVPVYVEKFEKLRYRMLHPSGGVSRWLPLAHWVGWPKSQDRALTLCMTLESGGRRWAKNGPYNSLLQIYLGSFNPESNLRQGLKMWRSRGWQPWPPMTARGY